MIIEKPLEWQKTLDETDAPLNLNGSERFWNTIEDFGFKTLRNGSPEFTEIFIHLNEDEDYEYYFKLKTSHDIIEWNWEHEGEEKEHFFEVKMVRKGIYNDTLQSIQKESMIPFIMENLNSATDISFVTPFKSVTIRLKGELGLQLSTQSHLPYIDFRFVEIGE